MSSLSIAPDTPFGPDGDVLWGTYRGSCQTTDLAEGAARTGTGAGRRFLREKRWQWFGAGTSRVVCGGTLFDAGYATTVFLWVFDREAGRMLVDERDLLPPFAVDVRDNPGDGGGAYLRGLSRSVDFERSTSEAVLEVDTEDADMELVFETDVPDPMTAICPVGNGEREGVNVTQKQNCLSVRGHLAVGSRVFDFDDDGLGMLDYSHGLLARETSWTWVMACGVLEDGTRVGVNVSESFNDDRENVVWMGDEIQTIGSAQVEFDGDRPEEPWSVRSDDGRLDVSFVVEGLRHHETDFQLVSSTRLEPVGRVHGRVVDREVHDLLALGECHRARW